MPTEEDQAMTTPGSSPFSADKKIRKGAHPLTIDQALEAARAAGFMPTARSRPHRAHVQRSWNNAATIQPVPSGVVVKPAWTTAQMLIVAGVLFFFVFGVCLV